MPIHTTPKTDPDETSLQFPPRAAKALFRQQERRASRVIDESRVRIAAYMTRFWDDFYGNAKDGQSPLSALPEETRIEVNRLWGLVEMIDAALYPQAARVALMPDYAGRGDVPKMQAVYNDWLMRHQVQEQVHQAVVQTTLVGASGFKVGYEPGTARPTDRVNLEVIPAWSMLLDESCTSVGRERFRGVVNWLPLQTVQQKYAEALNGRVLVPANRTQPLSGLSTGEAAESPSAGRVGSGDAQNVGDADADGEWVRVVEFYNLVDPMRARSGAIYLGRMEIWVLDQPDGLSDRPLLVETMPFSTTAGRPLSPLRPLIFASHPIYPYRHLSVVERVMPQIKEINVWRSLMAMMGRRSAARIWGQVDGIVSQDQNDHAFSGEDSVVFKIDANGLKSAGVRDPKSALFALDPPAIDPMSRQHVEMLFQEFTWATGQSPNMRGEITEATKYEVQAANRAAEIGLKKAGGQLYAALAETVQVVGRAVILAMQDTSDSTGGFTPAASSSTREVSGDVKVAPVGALTTEQVVDGAMEDAGAGAAASTGEAEVRATVAPTVEGVDADPERQARSSRVVAVKPFPIRVDGRIEMVDVPDLDADPEIQFVDGVRTPLREEARKQAQLELVEMMQKLWTAAKKGDVLARAQMETIADAFELPASWRPQALEEAERSAAKPAAEPANEDDLVAHAGGAEPQPAPQPAPAASPQSATQILAGIQAQIDAGDITGAVEALTPIAQAIPSVAAAMEQARTSDDPVGALQAIVTGLRRAADSGGRELLPTEPPPAAMEA